MRGGTRSLLSSTLGVTSMIRSLLTRDIGRHYLRKRRLGSTFSRSRRDRKELSRRRRGDGGCYSGESLLDQLSSGGRINLNAPCELEEKEGFISLKEKKERRILSAPSGEEKRGKKENGIPTNRGTEWTQKKEGKKGASDAIIAG